MRAPGHGLAPDAAVHLGGAVIVGYLLLVIGPVMLAALTMLVIDRHFDGVFFDAGEGGAPLLYEHLTWIFFTGAYAGRLHRAPPARSRRSCRRSRASRCSATAARSRLAGRDRRARACSPGCRTCTSAPIPIGFDDLRDAVRARADGPDRAVYLQLDRDALGRRRCSSRAATLFALGAIIDDVVRARRRARLLGDPGRLAARRHDRGARATRSTCWSAAPCSAASPRSTTGSRRSPAG